MGYFDAHPMSGDQPMDIEDIIYSTLFTNEESEAELFQNDDILRERLNLKLNECPELFIAQFKKKLKEYGASDEFVLPFLVVQVKIEIQDKFISSLLKEMIKDGGAKERGYPVLTSNVENKYNGFTSPNDYACQLRDAWDNLMEGRLSYEELETRKGLLEVLNNFIETD